MRRSVAVALCLACGGSAAHASLSEICLGVKAEEGLCEVYQRSSNDNWSDIFHRYLPGRPFGRHFAVVIGVSEYDSAFGNLSAPSNEAIKVKDFLIKNDFDTVITVTDRAASRFRLEQIMRDEIPPLLREDGRFFFYFIGHGITEELPGERRRGYLVTSEAIPGRWSSMIGMDSIQNWSLSIARARQSLWLIDACFSGLASPQSMNTASPTTLDRLSQRGHHLLTAGVAGEEALIVDGRSVFTRAFLEAAEHAYRPGGEEEADGLVTLFEIASYVGKEVDQEIERLNAGRIGTLYSMSPQFSVLQDNDGQFFFFSNAVREKEPQAFPPGREGAEETATLATVNGTSITLGDLIVVRQGLPPQYQELPDDVLMNALVEQMFDQILLEQAARQTGIDRERAVQLLIKNQVRAVLADTFMQRATEARVTDAAIQQAYDVQYGSAEPVEEVRAAHMLVDSAEKAMELKAELDAGADFAKLAAEHGTDGTADRGGDLGWFVHEQMVPEFADAAFAMQPGEISAPVQSPFGWHLIKLEERRERPAQPLDEVRDQIVEELTQEVQQELLAELRDRAEIEHAAEQISASAIRADKLIAE